MSTQIIRNLLSKVKALETVPFLLLLIEEINKKISESNKGKILKNSTKEILSKINSKLTDSQVLEIDQLIKKKVKYNIISEKFNISPAQITSIKQRKTYKWLWTS